MAIEPQGPCQGFAEVADIPSDSVCRQAGSGDDGATTAEIEELIAAATDIVWVLLARPSVGICTATIHPVRNGRGWTLRHPSLMTARVDDYAGWVACTADRVRLDTPVVDITEVVVDGVTLGTDEYQLVDGCWLTRSDGRSWPRGSTVDLDEFSITYTFGLEVDPLVRDATVELVEEMWKEIQGYPNALPPTTRSVTRQGMSFQVDQDADRVRRAGPSMPKMLKAMSAYNPGNERFPAAVMSPDEDFRSHVVRRFP